MSAESRLVDLLIQFEENQERGVSLTPEELCRDEPGLLPEVRRALQAVARVPRPSLADTSFTLGPGPAGYELFDEIGRGGMGVVHRARDVRLGREVAVKLLLAGSGGDSPAAVRFRAEAQITGQLQHPGIPAVHELGTLPDGRPFLAMKLVKGRTLQDLLRNRPDPGHERGRFLAIFEALCQAVGYAHSHGVIHRDLKPANVMVGAFGEVQVMDWGLAKPIGDPGAGDQKKPSSAGPECERDGADPEATIPQILGDTPLAHGSATRTGSVLGTPAYMPPEQAGGEIRKLDARSDVFGLGALLCEVLTGQPPYQGQAIHELLLRAVRGELRETRAALEGCGAEPALVDLCRRCLAFRQEDRPEDGQAVADAVATIRHQAESRARQAELERSEAMVREAEQRKRRQVLLGSAAVVAVVLITGLAFSLWQMNRALGAEAATANQLTKTRLAEAATAAQLAKTQAAEMDARQKLGFAERSNDILGSVFEGLDPKTKYSTVSELRDALKANMEKAIKQLGGGSIGDPLVVAKMQGRLGLSLLGLGEFNQAIVQLQKSRDTRKDMLGIDHPDTLTSMNSLARGYHAAGKLDLALPMYQETLKLRNVKLGPDHPETLLSMGNLAQGYLDSGKLDLALPLLEQTAKHMKDTLGTDSPLTLTSMNNLALGYQAAGKLDKALPLLEDVWVRQKAILGDDDPEMLATMNNLALSYQAAGKLDKALPLLERSVKRMKARLGVDHPDTLLSMNNLAEGYYDAGKIELTLPLHEEILKVRKANLGADHPDTILSMSNLAGAYQGAGRPDLALPAR